jgi:hypothetical protein
LSGDNRITRFSEFWLFYLREHARPPTRAFHYAGTMLATASIVAVFVTGHLWLVVVALLAGYGPAWIGHLLVEKNRPATLSYPLWSLICDYRMTWSWVTGQLPRELARAKVNRAR